MATSSKDIQKDVDQKINKFRENENAVYVLRVVLVAVLAIVISYVTYLFISVALWRDLALDMMNFKQFLWFNVGFAFVLLMGYVGFRAAQYVWAKSEAINKSSSKDAVDTNQAI